LGRNLKLTEKYKEVTEKNGDIIFGKLNQILNTRLGLRLGLEFKVLVLVLKKSWLHHCNITTGAIC